MEEGTRSEENDKLGTQKICENSTLTFGSEGRPEPLITIKNNKVNVKTLQMSMSLKHRLVMCSDIFAIAFVSGITVFMSLDNFMSQYVWIIIPMGFLVLLCAIGKTLVDFLNWLFTMNAMLTKMGEWYMEDVVNICRDFISAGVKFAAEEIKKAVEDKPKTEADDAKGEFVNP